MKSLLLGVVVPLILAIAVVNGIDFKGPEEGHILDSIAITDEPLNTPFDMLPTIEDDNDQHEIELRNSVNPTTAEPSGDCESNGGECKKNNKQCKDITTTEFTCSNNGVCCVVEVKVKSASELMQEMLSNVILIQGMAFRTMKDNQENSMVNLTKTIANQEIDVHIINSNISEAILDNGLALQNIKSNLSDTILNQGIAIKINQDRIMSNLSDGFSNQENMLQIVEDNQESIMSNLTQYGCPEGFFQLSPSGQCFKFFYDQKRTWYEANTKCTNEGLVSAKPSDPLTLRKYLLNTYGNYPSKGWPYCWLPARGTGSSFQWYPNGGHIYSYNPYWYSYSTSYDSSTYCIFLYNEDSTYKAKPIQPYGWANCNSRSYYTVCELIKE